MKQLVDNPINEFYTRNTIIWLLSMVQSKKVTLSSALIYLKFIHYPQEKINQLFKQIEQ